MKKALLLIVALLCTLPLPGGEPYFCTRPGTKLYYQRHKVKNQKLTQTTLMEIESFDGSKVRYAVTMKKASGSDMFGGRTLQTSYILPGGDTSLDFGQTVKGFVKNMFPSLWVTATGSPVIIPQNMQPGDTLPDTHCTVKVMDIRVHIDVTKRSILRRERITTPAGTFDCVVEREHKVENAPFHHLDNWMDNYYAPGLGYVRHDSFDKDMRLLEVELLVKVEDPGARPAASDGRP